MDLVTKQRMLWSKPVELGRVLRSTQGCFYGEEQNNTWLQGGVRNSPVLIFVVLSRGSIEHDWLSPWLFQVKDPITR